MGIGFQSTSEDEATVKMSRLPVTPQQVGTNIIHIKIGLALKFIFLQGTTILVEAVPFQTEPV